MTPPVALKLTGGNLASEVRTFHCLPNPPRWSPMRLGSILSVSVVIPLFDKADHIRQTIESVLAQSRRPEEILVIDDGSTDGGDRTVLEYAPRVSLVRRSHQGVSAARNHGIEIAKGEVIAFLDADDYWKPRFLENVAALLERFPQACAAGSAYEFLTKPGQISQFYFVGVPGQANQGIINYFSDILAKGAASPLHSSGVIARTSVLKQIGGFPAGARWGEDHDTFARLALAGEIAFVNETLLTVNVIATNRASDSQSPRPALPAVATIANALAAAVDHKRREELRKYLKRLAFISPMNNLKFGYSSLARSQLIEYRRLMGLGPRWFALMLCSFLPPPLVRMLVLIRRFVQVASGTALRITIKLTG